jgi:hypothetical protein
MTQPTSQRPIIGRFSPTPQPTSFADVRETVETARDEASAAYGDLLATLSRARDEHDAGRDASAWLNDAARLAYALEVSAVWIQSLGLALGYVPSIDGFAPRGSL